MASERRIVNDAKVNKNAEPLTPHNSFASLMSLVFWWCRGIISLRLAQTMFILSWSETIFSLILCSFDYGLCICVKCRSNLTTRWRTDWCVIFKIDNKRWVSLFIFVYGWYVYFALYNLHLASLLPCDSFGIPTHQLRNRDIENMICKNMIPVSREV